MAERVRLGSLERGAKIRFLKQPKGIILYDINSLYIVIGTDGELIGIDRHPFRGFYTRVSGLEEVVVVER